jgi:hypothetical protein
VYTVKAYFIPLYIVYHTCRKSQTKRVWRTLTVEMIGIERTKTDIFFDGALGRRLVKIVPFNHPLTPLDLQLLQDELKARPDEERDVVIVCLGKEITADVWLEEYNQHRPVNKIEVIELRTKSRATLTSPAAPTATKRPAAIRPWPTTPRPASTCTVRSRGPRCTSGGDCTGRRRSIFRLSYASPRKKSELPKLPCWPPHERTAERLRGHLQQK